MLEAFFDPKALAAWWQAKHSVCVPRPLGSYAIEWEPTDKGNVRVLNDTGDYYRFFDATPHAEFLYECVERTIEVDLPAETSFLKGYDSFRRQVEDIVDMPDNTVDLLFRFLRQNDGTLSPACARTGIR